MKSKALACIFAMTLFSALAIPVRLAAPEQPAKQQQNGEHHRYRFVDIGTFGGPESYINNAFSLGSHRQINRTCLWRITELGQNHAFLQV